MIGNKMTSIIPYTHETNDIWVNDSPYNEQNLIYKHSYVPSVSIVLSYTTFYLNPFHLHVNKA